MNLEDMSSWRLKRKYFRALKDAWSYQRSGFENLAWDSSRRARSIQKILRERGWLV